MSFRARPFSSFRRSRRARVRARNEPIGETSRLGIRADIGEGGELGWFPEPVIAARGLLRSDALHRGSRASRPSRVA